MTFRDLNLKKPLWNALDELGYHTPTTIQANGFKVMMSGADTIGIAQTGTGKTAAFLLPLIQNILTTPLTTNSITALVIVPTRELAIQIAQHLEGFGYFAGISSIAV